MPYVSCAVRRQENASARAKPFSRRAFRRPESRNRSRIVSAQRSTSVGGIRTPASPTTSGKDDVLEPSTGAPQRIASTDGSPNPSYQDGYANSSAAEYHPPSS